MYIGYWQGHGSVEPILWSPTNLDLDAPDEGRVILSASDYNGDGYPDLLMEVGGSQQADIRVYWNRPGTSHRFSNTDYQVLYTMESRQAGEPFRATAQAVGDMNGDGIPDLAVFRANGRYDSGSAIRGFLLSKGNGTTTTLEFKPEFLDITLDAINSLVDVNGDGLPDWVGVVGAYGIDSTWSLRLNQGDGSFGPAIALGEATNFGDSFMPTPNWTAEEHKWDYRFRFKDAVKVKDLNGDGKSEILFPGAIAVEGCYKVDEWNTGDTWTHETRCGAGLIGNVRKGKDSMVPISASEDNNIYQYKAVYFDESDTGIITARVVEDSGLYGSGNGTMVVDAYGKGLPDMVFTYGCHNSGSCGANQPTTGAFAGNFNKVFINRNYGSTNMASPNAADYVPIDILKEVNNGLGKLSQWDYSPLSSDEFSPTGEAYYDAQRKDWADGEHFNFASSMYAVASFKQSNGVGGLNETQYQYRGAVYNNQGRGFRGFKSITQVDMVNGVSTHTRFKQKFPYSSLVEGQSQFVGTSEPGDGWDCSSASTTCPLLSYTTNDWQSNPQYNGSGHMLYNASASTTNYDTGDSEGKIGHTEIASTVVTVGDGTSDIDQYGNILKRTSTKTDAYGTYSTTQLADYSLATRAWPGRYESKTVVKHRVVRTTEGLTVATDNDNDKVVKTSVGWKESIRKPETVTIYHRDTSGTGTEAIAATATTITTTGYNGYGLPIYVDVVGNTCNGNASCNSPQTRRVTTSYSKSGSAKQDDGYFPYQINQLVEVVDGGGAEGGALDDLSPDGEPDEYNDEYHTTTTVTDPATGLPTRVTDVTGVLTSTLYDNLARPIQISRTGFPAQKIGYEAASGNNATMRIVTKQPGTPQTREYKDLLGRTVRTETQHFDGSSYIKRDVTFNSRGLVTVETNPYLLDAEKAETTFSAFDTLGRPGTKVAPQTNGNLTTTYIYDGLVTGIKVVADKVSFEGKDNELNMSRTYNSLQQLVETKDAASKFTKYAYDGSGNPIVIQDAAGNKVTAKYDALGRKEHVNDPNQGRTEFTYNDFGELEKEKDANGDWIYYDMDLLGRVTRRTGDNGAAANFGWDDGKDGLLAHQSVNGHSTSYTYDSAARVKATTVTIDGVGSYTTTTHYDANYGRPKALEYPAVAGNTTGLTIEYAYNAAGYLVEEKNAQSGHAYRKVTAQDAFGNIKTAKINNNGLTGEYTYNTTSGQMLSSKVGASHHLQYTLYDSFGNLMEVENRSDFMGATTLDTYAYDSLHRLVSSSYTYAGETATISYGYDDVGNITKKSDYSTNSNGAYSYVAGSNKLQSVALKAGGTDTFGYDAKGNQTHRNGSQEVWYNAFNKPTQINRNGSNIELSYGADLMRYKQVRSETDGTTSTYYIGKHFEVEQKAGEPTKYNHFISDIAILTLRGSGIPEIAYTHRDRLGSATTITDENNKVDSTRFFDPFGKPRGGDWAQLSPARLASNLFDQRQDIRRGFTDHEHLDQAELIHMNGRVYDYNVGRFMSVDPFIHGLGGSQGINPYSYIMNNPLSGTDPSGYSPCSSTGSHIPGGGGASKCNVTVDNTSTKNQQKWNELSNAIGQIAYNGAKTAGNLNGGIPDVEGELEKAQERKHVGGNGTNAGVSKGLQSAFYGYDEISSAYNDFVWNSSDSGGLGLDDAASLAVGFTPAGIAADLYTAINGEDYFTGDKVTGFWRYAGLVPFVSEARKGYKGVKEASALLKSNNVPREYRKQIIESFEIDTIQIRKAGNNEYGLRYFDNFDAAPDGRYLFETFPATRQSLALPPSWNQMTGIKQWQINPGTIFIEGRAAAQGAQYPGGQIQKFVLDPSKDLK